jgi:hypothetical protein
MLFRQRVKTATHVLFALKIAPISGIKHARSKPKIAFRCGMNPSSCGGGSMSSSGSSSSGGTGGVRISGVAFKRDHRQGKTRQFTAIVSHTRNTAVTWSATAGTFSSTGLFTAPRVVSTVEVKITATSQTDSSKSASVVLTISPAATVTGNPVQHSVSLSWKGTTASNVVKYNMYRSTISGGYYGHLGAAIAGGTYTDQSVQSGTIYYYVVTAVDPQGQESPYSNETRATIP